MRKTYLDNIRWITVVLVLVYHVFYMFNASGVAGSISSFSDVQYQDTFLYFVYPWFMVILFVVSGMCSYYALNKKSNKQFIKDRTVKLLIPSTLGLFVFQWITGYMNLKIGGALETIPVFLRYPIMVLSGTGPLWFIQTLWLFSIILVLIRKIDKNNKFYNLCGKCNILIVLGLFVLIWGGSQILNPPVITTYRFGIYFVAFLTGYFVFSHDEIMDKVEKIHIPALIVAAVMGVAYTAYFFGKNYAADECLKHIFTSIYLWTAVIAILGCSKAWLNKSNAFTEYMSKSSFGIYIVHYVIILISCYFLKVCTKLPALPVYIIAIIAVLVLSPCLYEILKRIPVVRYFVLGIKKPKKTAETK